MAGLRNSAVIRLNQLYVIEFVIGGASPALQEEINQMIELTVKVPAEKACEYKIEIGTDILG